MFWLILLAIPHHRRRHYHRYWKHPRFHRPLYWLTGLAIMEGALWFAAIELAGELLGLWWLLYAAVNGVAWLVQRWWYVPESVSDAIAVCRPLWPSRETVKRRIAEGRPAD